MTFKAKLSALMLLLVSSLLLYLGLKMLLADISAFAADNFLNDWQRRGNIGSFPAWHAAHQAAQRTLQLSPAASGADFHRIGRIYEWQNRSSHPGAPEATHSRRAALQAYQQAAQLRPSWPYSWARVAQVKMELLEFDAEFDQAIHKSIQYGQWRPTVNFRIAMIGLISWHELDGAQRTLILDAAARSIRTSPHKAKQLIEFANDVHLCQILCDAVALSISPTFEHCPTAKPLRDR